MYTTACVKGDALVADYPGAEGESEAASSDLLAVGRAYTGGRVKVVDPDTGTTLPRGHGSECVGELHFGGDTVIKEYLGGLSPDSFYTEDGWSWFKTGDQGRMAEDGSIFMLGRYKDMIKRGGENIFAQQLEYTLQSVCWTKTQIIGIPDPVTGEACVAVVDTAKSENFSKLQLQIDVSKHIGPEFVFVHIITLQDLGLPDYPVGPGGKVRKPVLKKLILEHLNKTKQPDALVNGKSKSTTNAQGQDYWIEFVKSVWADLLHVESSQFCEDFRLEHFTDSLTAMRYCFEIERLTSKRLTVADIRESPTIRAQAKLVSGASVETHVGGKTDLDVHQRTGPPTIADVVICRGQESKFQEIQSLAKPVLERHGLTWESDVQDCFGALPLWGATVLLPPTRTFNLRFVFEVHGLQFSEVREALLSIVKVQPILVSTGINLNNGLVYLKLRPSDHVLAKVITREPDFDSVDAAVDHSLHNPFQLVPHPPEMLARFGISPVSGGDEGEGPVHVITLSLAHSVCDGMTNHVIIAELEAQVKLLRAKKAGEAAPHHVSPRFIPYNLLCDMYESLDSSVSAQNSRDLVASRFHGVSKEQGTAWPLLDPAKVLSLWGSDGSAKTDVYHGGILVQRSRRVPGILALQDTHGIPPSVALKVAYGLAVMQMTGKKTALFLRVDAARHWPFQDAWTQSHLPNPLLVGGPTAVLVWERLRLQDGGVTLMDIFRRVQAEDAELAPHTHVFNSHEAIMAHLAPEDAAFVRESRCFDPKIVLNHVPDVGRFTGADGLRALRLRGVSFFGPGATPLQSGFDAGDRELCVLAGLVDETKWDDAEGEFSGFEEKILRTLGDIVKPENWDAAAARFAEPVEE
ncbi:putative amp-binding enzyme family protein [Diaporthe ampelina]|uniref:Putative amp-binding enzyme family protein n=1 Tax=Diaporthe ampelina TaxID=1214573 RepID=A0A0G2H833_9PEZI|nr:putative amp-binding enzyme family protein [Diaporthe ampelina]